METETMTNQEEITGILLEAKEGSKEAYDSLLPLVYDQLKNIARYRMLREMTGHTYSRTDLVHEAYFHLINVDEVSWQDRTHFYAIASRCMRRILIDHARKKQSKKRGGDNHPVTYMDEVMEVRNQADELINLDNALTKLAELNERLAQVVECRYFGDMSVEDTAEALDISASTVKRDWAKARGWLYKELKGRFSEG